MTQVPNLEVTVKFYKGGSEKGFGFFLAPGLPDVHISAAQLAEFGFQPNDMTSGVDALLHAELFRDEENELRARTVKLLAIGEKLASAPVVKAKPQPKPEVTGPASDIEPAELSVRRLDGRKIHDIVPCRLDAGFDKKKPNHGFFQPIEGSARSIFVHITKVAQRLKPTLGEDGHIYNVVITDINDRGFVGEVTCLYSAGVEGASEQIAERLAEREMQREERRVRQEAARMEIVMRGKISVCSGDKTLTGYPVCEGEWERLEAGTPCVLVESFDASSGRYTRPIERFMVEKRRGTSVKKDSIPVTAAASKELIVKKSSIKSLGTGIFKVDEHTISAPIFEIVGDGGAHELQRLMRQQKLVQVAVRRKDGTYWVGKVQKDSQKLQRIAATLVNRLQLQAA